MAKLISHVFPAPIVPCQTPVLRRHLLHFPGQRLLCAFVPAEQVIEHIHRKFILIVRNNHFIPALAEIVGCRADCPLQLGYGFRLLIAAPGIPRLIFKNQEEPARHGFPGADLLHELQIVLLHKPALPIGLLRHLTPHCIDMAPDIRPSGQHLELELHRAYLQIGNKRIDDAPLLPGAPEQEIDGNHLHNLHIAVVFGVYHTVLHFGNREILR